MKRLGCEAIHSSYSTEVNNKWSYTYTTIQHITPRCLIMHFSHKIPIALNVFSRYLLSVFTKDVTIEMCIPCSLSVFTRDVTTETCIPCLLSVFTIDVTTDMYIPCSRFANQNFNSRITLMFGCVDNFFCNLLNIYVPCQFRIPVSICISSWCIANCIRALDNTVSKLF